MPSVRVGLISLWLWAVACAAALADEGVLLRQRQGLRDGLCAALRIQLSGAAEVRCESEGHEGLLPARIAAAATRVRESKARLGVLLERDPDPDLVRVYIVAAEGDRAVIAFEPIEDRAEPDIDRSLALKIRDAYEMVVMAKRALAAETAAAGDGSSADPSARAAAGEHGTEDRSLLSALVVPRRQTASSAWLLFLEAGGGLSLSAHSAGLGSVALGIGREVEQVRWELGLGARFSSAVQARADFGEVTLRERAADLSLRALWLANRHVQLGGVFAAGVSFASAEGRARDGDPGDDTAVLPVLGLGADLRVHLFATAHARLAPMLEVLPINQRWAIDGRPLLESQHARFTCTLSLLVALPIARGVQPNEGVAPP